MYEEVSLIVFNQILEEFRDDEGINIADFVNENGTDYCWNESIESILESFDDNRTDFQPRDIIMTPIPSVTNQHRLLIVDKVGKTHQQYGGFIMSSNTSKSNKKDASYPDNIYVDNFNSIIEKANRIVEIPCMVEVHRKVWIDKAQLNIEEGGIWKGRVTEDFFNFILSCYRNRNQTNNRADAPNRNTFWMK